MATTIPNELITRPQWLTWRYELEGKPVQKGTEGATKVPYNARTGHKASSTNPNTWATYDVAVRAAKQRGHAGVGYVFSADDPYAGIDLDDCIVDGALEPWAAEIVGTMQSYTEISPSGSGVKIWVEGTIPSPITPTPVPGTSGKIEMYDKARYFTVTGRLLDGTPSEIRNVNGALTTLHSRYKKPEPQAPTPQARTITTGDEHAQQWARKVLARAIEMVALASDGTKHDTLLDAARLAAGAAPLISEWEIETALFAAIEGRAADKHGAQKTIRDGIRMGASAPLPVPEPPPQPTFDADGFACCPAHARRLNPSKNGNGYKCRERDTSTASGWCDFWWKGDGYIQPRGAGANIIAGELITADVSPTAAIPIPRFVLYNLRGLRGLPPIEWLIPGEIPAGLTTIICGPSGAGKSFLSLDYALRIARKYPDRAVVYIAPEGGSGYRIRAEAWLDRFGGDEPENIVWLLQAVPMLNVQAVQEFITAIRSINPVMVVVDTLARCLVGGDENSAKDVGLFFYHTDLIRQETGAAIAIVHHTGKAGAYRGSSALYGSVESWIDVANDDGLITVSCGKSKDAQPFAPRYLRMVETGESVVLLPSDQVSQRSNKLTEGQRKTLETLALDIFTGPGAKRAELVSATGVNEVTMYKILSRLKRDNLIEQSRRGDPYKITHEGMAAIKNYHRDLRQEREKLSNYQDTITEVSGDSSSQLSNYHSLFIKRESDSSVEDDSLNSSTCGFRTPEGYADTELFPEESEPVSPVVTSAPAPPAQDAQADWGYLRKMWDLRDDTAIRRHCTIYRLNFDDVVNQLAGPDEDENEVAL